MEKIRNVSIELVEGKGCPILKIDGEEIHHITKLILNFDSENTYNATFENGFLVEYFNTEDDRPFKQTLGQSFSI